MQNLVLAIDFDGTLAHYDGYKGPGVFGEPIPMMVENVKGWMADGHEVVIFTSRFDGINDEYWAMRRWLDKQFNSGFHITNIKEKRFTHFFDDRAYNVRNGIITPMPSNLPIL